MEVALTKDTHAEMPVEPYCRIVSVYIQFDPQRASFRLGAHEVDGSPEKNLSEPHSLLGRQHIYLLKVEDRGTILGDSVRLHGNISARTVTVVCNMIDMTFLQLLMQIGKR